MNKHTLGYGFAAVLLAGTITAGSVGLHTKNETIESLKVEDIYKKNEIESLNAEKKDVMSANSQLSEKIEVLESDFKEMQDQFNKAGIQIEKLNKENEQLEADLQAKKKRETEEAERIAEAKKLAESKTVAESKKSGRGWSTFTATYYDANYASTGKSPGHPAYGVTASGERVKTGETIAVDPRVIPLGSWVEVKYPDGRVEKRKATDTGGAIKGKKIDIYIAKASYTSGKHSVQVRVIN